MNRTEYINLFNQRADLEVLYQLHIELKGGAMMSRHDFEAYIMLYYAKYGDLKGLLRQAHACFETKFDLSRLLTKDSKFVRFI